MDGNYVAGASAHGGVGVSDDSTAIDLGAPMLGSNFTSIENRIQDGSLTNLNFRCDTVVLLHHGSDLEDRFPDLLVAFIGFVTASGLLR